MNKTIDVSLAGLLFHLEEASYYKLKKYLRHVKNSLDETEDTEEIMNEIEARIAELLTKKISNPQQVIKVETINEIIEIIGKPEDFEAEKEYYQNKESFQKKKLFRDTDKIIGGVAAGFAHYIGLDVSLMRILFILILIVSHGTFLLVYILLWAIVPKADHKLSQSKTNKTEFNN